MYYISRALEKFSLSESIWKWFMIALLKGQSAQFLFGHKIHYLVHTTSIQQVRLRTKEGNFMIFHPHWKYPQTQWALIQKLGEIYWSFLNNFWMKRWPPMQMQTFSYLKKKISLEIFFWGWIDLAPTMLRTPTYTHNGLGDKASGRLNRASHVV